MFATSKKHQDEGSKFLGNIGALFHATAIQNICNIGTKLLQHHYYNINESLDEPIYHQVNSKIFIIQSYNVTNKYPIQFG